MENTFIPHIFVSFRKESSRSREELHSRQDYTFKIYIFYLSRIKPVLIVSRSNISFSLIFPSSRWSDIPPVPHRYDRRIPIYRKKRCVPRAKTRSIVAGIILGWRTIARKCSKGRLNSAGGGGKWWKQWRGVSRGEGKSLWISLRLNRHFEAKYLWDENAWNASSGRQATRFSRRRIVN